MNRRTSDDKRTDLITVRSRASCFNTGGLGLQLYAPPTASKLEDGEHTSVAGA